MNPGPVPVSAFWTQAAVGLTVMVSLALSTSRADDSPPADAQKDLAQPKQAASPWRAFGRVTDRDGRPVAGVEISAHCGSGSLRRTGVATSGADGRYELNFGPGILFPRSDRPRVQAATISAHKPGLFEENLNRQGDCIAADGKPDEDELRRWGGRKDRLFLPDRPLELNFVMRPAARVAGTLTDEGGKPLARYSVALNGVAMPPSSSVVRSTQTDEQGRFSLEDIPTNHRYQFEVRKADPKPPWDDSWASAALRFERPDGDDLHAWFGSREIRIRTFVLQAAGPGVDGRTATPVAGNAGVLDLTAADPAEVLERKDDRLVVKSAVLTLRNPPRSEPNRSLVPETVPAASAVTSKTKLARFQPNEAGEFTVSFENPPGFTLEAGKHQVIFQVFVGVSQRPIREKIFRQLDARPDGRYEVPVKVAPEWINDSRVSITFVTIQPDHDAWVRTFFQEGKGTSYKGIWAGDGGLLPAIPFEAVRLE